MGGFMAKENSLISVSLVCLVVLGLVLTSSGTNASTSGSAGASVTVSSACNMSTTVDTTHSADVANGAFEENIGETTIKTTCNDGNGFALYAIGYTGDTLGNNYLRDNAVFTQHGNTYDIQTGTGQSGNSQWAMKVSAVSNGADTPTIENSFNNYHTVPSDYTLVASKSSGTTSANASEVKATYSAYISSSQPAGLYEGKVKYVMVHPASHVAPYKPVAIACPSGKICYNANTDEHEGTMGQQSISTSATSATLLASNFSRTGYGFAGWSDAYDYTTNANAHFYGPNEDIIFTAGQYSSPNSGLALYAVWVASAGSLQNSSMVSSVCAGLTQAPLSGATLSSVSALTDERDNQTYAIAKLADGNCWMIENLRLESTNSDNSTGSLAQGYNSSFVGLADAESANFTDSTTANSLYSTDGSTTATISGSNQSFRFPRYNNTNTSTRASSPIGNSGSMYSYGNYYTWHAAIADTTHNETINNSSDTTSICPKGWRLPHGGQTTVNTTAEFYLLGKAIMNNIEPDQNASDGYGYYGNSVTNTAGKTATAAFRSYPNNFLYSGNFDTSSAINRGSNGNYWSSTAYSHSSSYRLYLTSSSVRPGTDSFNKYYGYSIRCVSGS